jgi:hypothetical protein
MTEQSIKGLRQGITAGCLAVVFIASACATYDARDEEALRGEDPAYLSVPMMKEYWGIGGASLRISRVDDQYMETPRPFGAISVNSAILQPGNHTIGLHYSYRAWCGYIRCAIEYDRFLSITFDAESGHRYRANVEREEDQYWIWIEDKTTGEIVAGQNREAVLPTVIPASACSNAESPGKPWVGKWASRTNIARFTFEIEEAVVRGEVKLGSKAYLIFGKVNEHGAIDAKIFGRGAEGGPLDVRGTFPNLQLTYPYAQGPIFKALNGQTIRLCS